MGWNVMPRLGSRAHFEKNSSQRERTRSPLLVHVTRSFFFFQAEDGIRDLTVTGVQTCALPISAGATRAERPSLRVGSKSFTESYILAEIVAQIIDETGEARAERRLGLGGTGLDRKSVV